MEHIWVQGALSCNWCPSFGGYWTPSFPSVTEEEFHTESPDRQRAIAARITGRLRGLTGREFPAQAERRTSSERLHFAMEDPPFFMGKSTINI